MSQALAQERLVLGSDRLPRVLAGGVSATVHWQRHTVEHLEINTLCRGGPVSAVLNGLEHQLTVHSVYCYRPGDVFSALPARADGQLQLQWVRFDWPGWRKATADIALPLGRITTLPAPRFTALRTSLDQILTLHRHGSPGWQLEAAGVLLQVLAQLRVDRLPPAAGPGHERLALALAYLEQHLAEPLPVEALARAARTSPDYLARLFRAALGRPPVQYLIERRLQAGRRLLVDEPAATIREVARRVGIPHASHFSRLFVRRFGQTPQRFRLATVWRR